MPPVCDQPLRGGGIRFLDEPRDGVHAGGVAQRFAALDIAVAGLRPGGVHAEGDEPAGSGGYRGDAQRTVQFRDVGDRVVGGEHPQQAVGIVFGGEQGGGGDGGGAVAADWFQHQPRIRDAGGAQLLGDQEPMLVVADHDRRGEAGAAGAQRGLLHQGALGGERPELLGEALARDGPQAGAGPTGQDDGDDAVLTHAADCAGIGRRVPLNDGGAASRFACGARAASATFRSAPTARRASA